MPAIPIPFYMPRLSDDALDRMASVNLSSLFGRAPRFAGWLSDVLALEQTRRLRARRQDLREADLAAVDLSDWTDAELGAAVLPAMALAAATIDPVAAEFARRVAMAIGHAVRARLTGTGRQ